MSHEREHDEERLAALLRELREPPAAWTEAAKQAPAARREIEDLVARAEADQRYREQVLRELETALREAGHEPDRKLVAALRARLTDPEDDPADTA